MKEDKDYNFNPHFTSKERDRIIVENMHLVPKVASEYRDYMSMDQLISAGNEGLIVGVDKFDPTRGFQVSTYVVWWIRQRILKELYENRNVRLPFSQINEFLKDKENENNRFGGKSKVKMEVSLDTKASNMHVDDNSDDDRSQNNRGALENMFASSVTGDFLASVETKEFKDHMKLAIDTSNLSGIERSVVTHYFGLDGCEPKTLRELGDLLGKTHTGVMKIRDRSLLKMKKNPLIKGMME